MKKGGQHYSSGLQVHPHQKILNEIVDYLGEASANAQGLPTAVTNSKRFFISEDRLYLLVHHFDGIDTPICKIYGMLKVGRKKLFIRDEIGNVKEIEPNCVLDFYVHEACQRSGYGKFLFEYMLDLEQESPHKLGYDRPSTKLLNFLKKHYGLENYVPQVNNFVVFSSYFLLDKTFRTYAKDPVKPREKVQPKPEIRSDPTRSSKPVDSGYSVGFQNYSKPQESYSGAMPSYKEAKQMQESMYPNERDANIQVLDPKINEGQIGSYAEVPDSSEGHKKVRFSDKVSYQLR